MIETCFHLPRSGRFRKALTDLNKTLVNNLNHQRHKKPYRKQMIQFKKYNIIFLCLTILLGSCNKVNKNKASAIIIKMSYDSKTTNSHGGRVILQNRDTKSYFTGSSRDSSSYILLEGIPCGTYKIKEFTIFYANYGLNLTDATLFNPIKIEDTKIYYLGNYHTKLMEPESKFTHRITSKEEIEKDIILQELAMRKNDTWSNVKIAKDQTLFKNSNTIIYRSNKY